MMDTKRICSLIEERKEELFELLSSLVRINSENFSTGGNEEECAKYIDKLCRGLGLESDVYSPMELPGFSEYGIAAALFIIKLLKEEGFVPKRNLLFAGYCDEERGGSHGAMAAVMKYPCKRIVNMDGRDQIWHCGSGC